jgi:hypothetical protein
MKITTFAVLLAFVAFNIVFANASIEERLAAKKAILEQEMRMNSIEPPLPTTDDTEEYCASTYTNTSDDWITNVTFNTINNSTGQDGPSSYGDYTGISTDVVINQTYNLSVSFYSEGLWTEHVRVWIDWNQNEIFEASESFYLGSGVDATLTMDITIPVDAVPGPTRLRVIEQWLNDPGGDGACDDQGSHSLTYGETEDYTVNILGAGEPGFLMGTVTDLQMNPIDGAEVTVGSYSYTTGPDGAYMFELYALTYSATATAQYHNPVTVDDIVIAENETTVVDFALPTPQIDINTETIQIDADSGDVITVQRTLSNIGDGYLDYDVQVVIGDLILTVNPGQGERIENVVDPNGAADVAPYSYSGSDPPVINDFQDSLFCRDLGFLNETQCLGMEFDGTYFWVTGGNSGSDPNILYKLDAQGNFVEQFNQNGTTIWGWRDMAFDGEFLYASDDGIVDQIDPTTGDITGVTFSGPENPNRALAYNPDNDHFYTANFGSSIYEFDRTGTVHNVWTNSKAIYGMAYDNVSDDGPWLWVFSQDGSPQQQITQFNPQTGTYTSVTWQCALPTGFSDGIAGGACLTTDWDPSVAVLFLLGQGTPNDFIYGYEIAPFSRWLAVDPMSGGLDPAGSIDLDITVDFSGPNINYDSTYMANLIINNNTPVIPEIPVIVNGIVGVDEDVTGLPDEFYVAQNYPNPFNARTSISFSVPQQSDVKIEVFNLLGQKTATLAEGLFPAGNHTVTWDASDVASGVYYYRISAGDFSAIKMMTLLK